MELAAIILASIAITISVIQFSTSHRPFIIFDIDHLNSKNLSLVLLPFKNTGATTAVINSVRIRRAAGKWVSFPSEPTSSEPGGTFGYVVNCDDSPFGTDGKQRLEIEFEIEYQNPLAFSLLVRRFGYYRLVDNFFLTPSTADPPVLPVS